MDIRAAIEFGADALGFIAVPESPRYVSAEQVRLMTHGLPPLINKVVVARSVSDAVDYSVDVVQFYTGSPDKSRPSVRVFRIKDTHSLAELVGYPESVDAFHLDTYHEGALGGIGKTFDWSLAREARKAVGDIPIILAGGLTPENVADAVAMIRPYAVDVSSGVEAEPGRKDHAKLKAFIEAVRKADLSL